MATQGYKRYIYEEEFLNFKDERLNTEKNLKNDIFSPKNYTVLIDTETGYEYIVEISGGKLITRCKVASISANVTGDVFIDSDTITGITIYSILQDGTKTEITNYKITNIDTTVTPNVIEFSYMDLDNIFTTSISTESCLSLIDFEYIIEENGTYTLTEWKGTYNGKPSTEIIIPNSELINL